MSIRNFGNNDLSISRGWTGMQQVLGRGGEARLKVRKEGGGNKSRGGQGRPGRRSDEPDTKAVVQRTTRMYPDIAKLSEYP